MQLPHLETFSKAAELANFTAAAKSLHLTQAAVSQRIHALEKELGKSLFQRRGGRVLLTEAGQKLYEYAQRILELQREARQEIAGHQTPLAGELTLAASSIPGEHILPAILSVFRRKHPHIQVRVAVSDSMTVMAQVERGQASLGFVGRRTDNPHLEFRAFAKDRIVLVVPRRHALRGRKKLSLGDLCRYPLIVREPGSGLRDWFEKALQRVGRSPADLQVALELGSNESIKEAVLRGAGAAVLSIYAVRKEAKSGRLRALDITDLDCQRDMFIVQDRRRVLPLPARQFLMFLESHPISAP
jgi:LysR family transcriptional regulator, low CO2-responsive transcriptional regulator